MSPSSIASVPAMPQPLSSFRNIGTVSIANGGDSPAIHRPELALRVAHVIATHSLLENFVAMAFMKLLGSNEETTKTVAAIFNTIRSANGQEDALKAAARVGLDGYQHLQDVCFSVFAVCKKATRPRNVIAHWIWGHATGIPDGVLLIDPTTLSSYFAAVDDVSRERTEPSPILDNKKIMVYTRQDFEQICERMERAKMLVASLLSLLSQHRIQPLMSNDNALLRLSNEPEIQTELLRQTRAR